MNSLAEILNLHLPIGAIAARIILALLCGGAVGWDRETHHKSAGLRTHMMVALGSALIMLLAMDMMASIDLGSNAPDPSRVFQGLLTGIGFIGGGVIMHGEHGGTKGLTTAAGVWVISVIGACCGTGAYGIAILGTAGTIVVLRAVKKIERRTAAKKMENESDGE